MIPSDIQRVSAIIFNTLSAESQLITCVSTTHLTNIKIATWPPRETSAIDHGAEPLSMAIDTYTLTSCLRCSKTQPIASSSASAAGYLRKVSTRSY